MGGSWSGKTASKGQLAPVQPVAAEPTKASPEEPAGAETADGRDALRTALLELERGDTTHIMLSSLTIEDAGVRSICKSLAAKPAGLETLNLGINRLTNDSCTALAGVLPSTALKSLTLERCGLTSAGIVALAGALPASLETLMIGRNEVGVDGAKALAQSKNQLHTLGVGFASLLTEGMKALVPALARLRVVDLAGNHIGGPGGVFVAQALPGSSLETLKLESNGVADEGARAFGEALAAAKKLKRLELRRNSVTDDGVKQLLVGLRRNSSLTFLDLFDNSITDAGARALLEVVQGRRSAGEPVLKADLNDNHVAGPLMSDLREGGRAA